MSIQFSLNRTCAPQLPLPDFVSLVKRAGVGFMEVRNDIEGREFANGMPASDLHDVLQANALGVASINALQRFNEWTPEREAEAQALVDYASVLGAPGIVMCPVIDESDPWTEAEAEANLRGALKQLKPVFADAGIWGYVEPLGMRGSTMKRQAMAVEAITDIDGWDAYRLCHDTFQFFRCGDDRMFPKRVGLVHISGIARSDLTPGELTEPDRGFVFENDRAGNLDQVRRLISEGYDGFVSIEPFSPGTQQDPEIAANLSASLAFLSNGLGK